MASTVNTNVINLELSSEQNEFITEALDGKNILVDACIGSGKTTAIQQLCNAFPPDKRILYLTYNRLLKLDAQAKIKSANTTVTNYHGFAMGVLRKANITCGIPELVYTFNRMKPPIDMYDVLILDEYQDIEQEFADMLWYIKSTNPQMQIIAVGDMMQKIYDKTTLNVPAFMDEFLGEHITLSFTKCFRLSAQLAEKLGRIWQKEIIGVNDNCIVEEMTPEAVVEFLARQRTQDILCLGRRTSSLNGALLSDTLNILEERYPQKFNKKTVYASIQDEDRGTFKAGNDELIDLSPCIGIYQEAALFGERSLDAQIEWRALHHPDEQFKLKSICNATLDERMLFLTALETHQERYRTQVSSPFVPDAEREMICSRLGGVFSPDDNVQVHCCIDFAESENGPKLFSARGQADVVKDNTVYELKFVSELTHEHFLQCASYMLAHEVSPNQ